MLPDSTNVISIVGVAPVSSDTYIDFKIQVDPVGTLSNTTRPVDVKSAFTFLYVLAINI